MTVKRSIAGRFILLVFILGLGCSVQKSEISEEVPIVIGLDGRKFAEPIIDSSALAKLDHQVQLARQKLNSEGSEENYIWLGRREAYRYHYKQAIDVFSEGLRQFPQSAKLLRHRGHRYITLRNFDQAIKDLEHARRLMNKDTLEREPDGIPNRLNTPLSNYQFNILYHLGLAYYLKGYYDTAAEMFALCMRYSNNDDLVIATADWLYMSYCRSGDAVAAERLIQSLPTEPKIIENDSYLERIRLYRGIAKPEEVLSVNADNEDRDLSIATQGYGVGNWYLCAGDTARALQIFNQVTSGSNFSAFGFIAAEADLVRLSKP